MIKLKTEFKIFEPKQKTPARAAGVNVPKNITNATLKPCGDGLFAVKER